MGAGTRAAASVQWMAHAVDFRVRRYSYDGHHVDLTDEGWVMFANEEETPPAFTLNMGAAQELFEQMWSQGFRSVHDKGSSDKLDTARPE